MGVGTSFIPESIVALLLKLKERERERERGECNIEMRSKMMTEKRYRL